MPLYMLPALAGGSFALLLGDSVYVDDPFHRPFDYEVPPPPLSSPHPPFPPATARHAQPASAMLRDPAQARWPLRAALLRAGSVSSGVRLGTHQWYQWHLARGAARRPGRAVRASLLVRWL